MELNKNKNEWKNILYRKRLVLKQNIDLATQKENL